MFTKSSLVFSLCASCAYAAFTPPARLDIPVVLSPGGRPMFAVGMGTQSAAPVQNFNFTLTTSIGYTSVANAGCDDCTNTPTYDISLSPDAKPLNEQSTLGLGAGNFSGSLIKENCTLATQQGTPWAYTNQTIVLMNNQSGGSPFENGVSGILGLGTLKKPTTAAGFPATFDDGLYGQYYIRNPQATNFTFGMALKPTPVIPGNSSTLTIPPGSSSLANSDAGTINWLQTDTSAYQADQTVWRTVQTNVTEGYLSGNEQPDLTVELDGWSAEIGTDNVGGSSLMVNLDPYYPGIYMPGSQARLIHDAIQGSQQVQKSTIQGETTSWEVPCNTALTFTVSVDSQKFTIDQSTLVVDQGDGTCISRIEGFTDSSVTQYIFGQLWISTLYLIFNIPQTGDSQIGLAPRTVSSTKSRDIGAIVGGTVGGVAGVVGLGLLAFYLIRRRQDNTFFKRAEAFEEERKVASTVEPYTFGSQSLSQPTSPAYSQGTFDRPGSYVLGPGSPPIAPHVPLLHERDANMGHLPPSYEEASEAGGSSSAGEPGAATGAGARAYPREKTGFRQDTMMSIGEEPSTPGAPDSPNQQSTFSGSNAV